MDNKLKALYNQCKSLQNTISSASIEDHIESSAFVIKYNQLRNKIIELDKNAEEFSNTIKKANRRGRLTCFRIRDP